MAGLVEQRGLSLRVGQLTDLVFAELASAAPAGGDRGRDGGATAVGVARA